MPKYRLSLKNLTGLDGLWNYGLVSPDGSKHTFCGCDCIMGQYAFSAYSDGSTSYAHDPCSPAAYGVSLRSNTATEALVTLMNPLEEVNII